MSRIEAGGTAGTGGTSGSESVIPIRIVPGAPEVKAPGDTSSAATGGGTPPPAAGSPHPINPGSPPHTGHIPGTVGHSLKVLGQMQDDHVTEAQNAVTSYGNYLISEDHGRTPEEREAFFHNWVSQFEDDLIRDAPKGADGKPTNPLLNPFFGVNARTAISVIMYQLARVLSQMSTRDAAMAILTRQATREMITEQVKAIIKQGDLEAEQYKKMAVAKIVQAVVTATVTVVMIGMTMAKTSRYNSQRNPEPTTKEKAEFQSTTSSRYQNIGQGLITGPVNNAMEAWTNFIQADYAPKIAGAKAQEAFYREYTAAGNDATRAQWENASKTRDNLESVIQNLMQTDPEMMKWGNLTRT